MSEQMTMQEAMRYYVTEAIGNARSVDLSPDREIHSRVGNSIDPCPHGMLGDACQWCDTAKANLLRATKNHLTGERR